MKKTNLAALGAALLVPAAACLPVSLPEVSANTAASQSSANGFINEIAPSAQIVAANHGLFASILIAQAMIESGNGTSQLSQAPYYNFFGIKAYSGEASVTLATQEVINGKTVVMQEPFRSYGDLSGSLNDYAATIQQNFPGATVAAAGNYQTAAQYLVGRYATAPNYAQALIQTISSHQLDRFDTVSTATSQTTTASVSTGAPAASSGQTYTVQNGDSVWSIAQNHGLTMEQLQQKNDMSDYYIYPGQTLNV